VRGWKGIYTKSTDGASNKINGPIVVPSQTVLGIKHQERRKEGIDWFFFLPILK